MKYVYLFDILDGNIVFFMKLIKVREAWLNKKTKAAYILKQRVISNILIILCWSYKTFLWYICCPSTLFFLYKRKAKNLV